MVYLRAFLIHLFQLSAKTTQITEIIFRFNNLNDVVIFDKH